MHFRLQVFLYGGYHQDYKIAVWLDKKGTGQVAYSLNEQVFTLSQIDCVYVGEGRVVAQHLDVDGPDEQFLHLFLGQVALEKLGLERRCLCTNKFVFFLL